jgi:hypothetical protein
VDYFIVPNQIMPDGFHQYRSTNPLTIPVSFKLHAFDKAYCPNGALSVLQIAALLHSFTLPYSSINGSLSVNFSQANPGAIPNSDRDSVLNNAIQGDDTYSVSSDTGSNFLPPTALRLDLMAVDSNTPGITCIGYLKDVKARLLGPFLRGPGNSYNLPTAGEFEFTFVHVPGYLGNYNITNNSVQQSAVVVQAFASNVQKKLYNTISIGAPPSQ